MESQLFTNKLIRMRNLDRAIALVLGTAALGIGQSANAAQNVYYAPATAPTQLAGEAGGLPAAYAIDGTEFIFTWDGHNAGGANKGYGWAHTTKWVNFTLAADTALDIKMTSTTTGTNADYFNSAFSLYKTANYTNPGLSPSFGGHTYSQVSTASANGWLTDSAKGGVTDFMGYANSGPTGWVNGAGKTIGAGAGGIFTVGNHNAELITGILPAGEYLLAVGSNMACGDFLSNSLPACTDSQGVALTGSGNFHLTITPTAVPIPAAAWLFGSALIGVGFTGRRKQQAV